MSENLIMPKGDGQLKPCIESIKIYYEANDWVSNETFKQKIAKALVLGENRDGPFLIKKSEIARYFGLIEYDFRGRKGRITDRGKRFYDAALNKDEHSMIDITMEAVLNDSFGRNNYASEGSDSDIDAPKLLLRASYDIPGLKKDEIAQILYRMHDLRDSYKNTIDLILKNRQNDWKGKIPNDLYNKYTDLKFKVFFQNIGILKDEIHLTNMSDYIYETYANEIEMSSVYNTASATESGMQVIEPENIEDEIIKKVPIYSNEDLLIRNNRVPILPNSLSKNTRYKTDYRISKTSLSKAGYKCELDCKHETFKTQYGIDYVEAHHIIPMSEQKNYPDINIDRTENIISLCPTCHRGIHFGSDDFKQEKLKKIYEERAEELKKIGIELSYEDLLNIYNVSI